MGEPIEYIETMEHINILILLLATVIEHCGHFSYTVQLNPFIILLMWSI